jgi:predicted nucleic acid-binding protein
VIVLDASAVVELLLDTPAGRRIAILIEDPALAVHVPHLLDVEVVSALRRLVRDDAIDADDAADAIVNLRALDLQRHAHEPLLDRMWELRQNVSAYDAVYLALAEGLEADLVTCDAKLGRGAKARTRIQLVN